MGWARVIQLGFASGPSAFFVYLMAGGAFESGQIALGLLTLAVPPALVGLPCLAGMGVAGQLGRQ